MDYETEYFLSQYYRDETEEVLQEPRNFTQNSGVDIFSISGDKGSKL